MSLDLDDEAITLALQGLPDDGSIRDALGENAPAVDRMAADTARSISDGTRRLRMLVKDMAGNIHRAEA